MEIIYIIEYDFYLPSGGSFKYSSKPELEHRIFFFSKKERDKFIEKYLDLLSDDKSLYIDNVRCYTAIPEEIVDMKSVVDAV